MCQKVQNKEIFRELDFASRFDKRCQDSTGEDGNANKNWYQITENLRVRFRSKYERAGLGTEVMHYVQEFGTRKKVEVLVSDLQAKQIIDDILKIIVQVQFMMARYLSMKLQKLMISPQ